MSGDYVYRTVAAPPPMFNEHDPLINHSVPNLSNRPQNGRPFYIYVFHGGPETRRRRLTSLFLYLAMVVLLTAMLVLFMTLFLSYTVQYRYMLFVRRWPPTICHRQDSCTKDAIKYEKWVIHGLWPEFSDNTWEQYCNNEQLNITELEPLRKRLLTEWPNLLNGKSVESLWQHEWRKHGTCTHMTQKEYFNKTLDLNEEYPLEERLKRAGIVPDSSHQYTREQFEEAIQLDDKSKKKLRDPNQSYVLSCEQFGKEWFIKEIMLCVSFHEPDEPTYCTMKSNCPEEFFYKGF